MHPLNILLIFVALELIKKDKEFSFGKNLLIPIELELSFIVRIDDIGNADISSTSLIKILFSPFGLDFSFSNYSINDIELGSKLVLLISVIEELSNWGKPGNENNVPQL